MYQLNIDIDPADLAVILEAGELVTIVKQTTGSAGGPQVAWVAFDPLQANSVSWQDSYTMYASRTQLEGNATINMMSQAPAGQTQSLPFTNEGSFQAADPTIVLPSDTYGVENQYTTAPFLVFGLAQEANVTGTSSPASPINASVVPMNQRATFQPLDVVTVFLQANTSNGMVINTVTGQPITLTFGGGTNEITIAYDAAIGGFTMA